MKNILNYNNNHCKIQKYHKTKLHKFYNKNKNNNHNFQNFKKNIKQNNKGKNKFNKIKKKKIIF